MNLKKSIILVTPLAFGLSACEKTVRTEAPSGVAAYEAIAVPTEVANLSQYLLRAGDRIEVRVLREEDFSAQKVLVDTSGNVSLPMIGSVAAAGLTQDALALAVQEKLAARYLRDPRVSVLVETPALSTVAVEGEVEQPGLFEVTPDHTLLAAIAQARSTTDRAKVDQVLIFRTVNGQRLGGRFDLARIRAGRDPDPRVLRGDVIVVGYSQVRGAFQDFLKSAPVFNIFTQF